MKYDDTTLQAVIDAAMIEIGRQITGNNFAASLDYEASWPAEQSDRLALAKAFLAKLPEAQPILADDGRSLGEVCADAALAAGLNRATSKECDEAAAQAVAFVVLAQAIRRMEAVPERELWDIYRHDGSSFATDSMKAVRARLIAAAKGEAVGINGLTEAEEAKTASVAGLSKPDSTDWKAKYEQAEAERKKWEEDALRYCKNADYWRSQAETIGILRPLSEAGPVPDGCSRISGYRKTDGQWTLAIWEDEYDTHFADIRLPSTETPATEADDPYARLKAYAKAGARIRLIGYEWADEGKWGWHEAVDRYEVHPDDLHLVPEYAPVTEQPKQKVPLGPEEKLQAIKAILEHN